MMMLKKARLLSILLPFVCSTLLGQTLIKVGSSETYQTIQDAYNSIAAFSGDYLIEIQNDYNPVGDGEIYPITFDWRATGADSIIIRPALGVASVTNAGAPPAWLNIIDFAEAENVILDGRPGGVGDISNRVWTIRNTRTSGTGLVGAVNFWDDAIACKLRYLIIESEADDNVSGTIDILNTIYTSGNDYGEIKYCLIRDLSVGGTAARPGVAIYCAGDPASTNDYWEIAYNEFVDHYDGASGSWTHTIQLFDGSDYWDIHHNSFYQTSPYTNLNNWGAFISIMDGGTYNIENNYFGGQSAQCGSGTFQISSGTEEFSFIYVTVDADHGGTVNVNGNVFDRFSYTTTCNTVVYPLSLVINESSSDLIFGTAGNGNSIGNQSNTDRISLVNNDVSNTSFGFVGVYNNSLGDVTVNNNQWGGLTIDGSREPASSYLVVNIDNANTTVTENIFGGTVANSFSVKNNSPISVAYNGGTLGLTFSNNEVRNLNFGATDETLFLIHNNTGTLTSSNNNFHDINSSSETFHEMIINLGGVSTIEKNNFEKITCTNTGTANSLFFIDLITTSAATVDSNTIGGSTAGDITFDGEGPCVGISKNSSGTFGAKGNTIQNIKAINTGTATTVYGIEVTNGISTLIGNTISGVEYGGSVPNDAGLRGISVTSSLGPQNILQNTISNLNKTSNSGNTYIGGISAINGSGFIEKNHIENIQNSSSDNTSYIGGILCNNSAYSISNNVAFISNGANSNDIGLYGLYHSGGTANCEVYHNTFLVGGNSSGNSLSGGIVIGSDAGSTDLQNNVFQNLRTGGINNHYAIFWDGSGTLNSDYNLLENNNASAICYDGSQLDFGTWQGNVGAVNSINAASTYDASGSPNIPFAGDDVSNDLTGSVSEDKAGTPRPSTPSIGAYEAASSPPGFYWVGNSGAWSDFSNHWATTSGGSTFHTSPPTVADDVFFDANSFSAAGETVTLDIDGFGQNLIISSNQSPVFEGNAGANITVAGNFTLNNGVSWDNNGNIIFNNAGNVSLTSSGVQINSSLVLSGGGSVHLEDDLNLNGSLTISFGIFNLQNSATTSTFNFTTTGNITNAGNFISSTGTVNLTGIGNQNLQGALNFNNLTINNTGSSGIAITGGTIQISGTLSLVDGLINNTTSSNFIINASGSSVGGNSNSYINGALKKIGNNDFTFFIGKDSQYAPLHIANLTGGVTTEFSAEFFASPYSNTTSLNAPLNNISSLQYWDLNRSGGLSDADITVFWGNDENQGINNAADLSIAHWNGGSWDKLGQTSINFGVSGDITFGPVSSFSPFTFGSDDPVLNPLALPDTLRVGNSEAYITIQSAYNAIPTPTDKTYWIELQADYDDANETPPITFDAKATALDSIVIVPAKGVSGTEVALNPGVNVPLFDFDGADYVTIDGRPGGSGPVDFVLRNTGLAPLSTGPVVHFINEATNNRLQHLNIESESQISGLIRITGSSSAVGNNNIVFDSCTFSDITSGGTVNQPEEGIVSVGDVGKNNENITIKNCAFIDIYNGANNFSSNIRAGSNSTSWNILDNHFFQSSDYADNCNFNFAFISISDGSDYRITGNSIGGQDTSVSSNAFTIPGGSATVRCIDLRNTMAAAGVNNIHSNHIGNFDITLASTIPAAPSFYGIVYSAPTDGNIGEVNNGNIIGDTASAGNILLTNNTVSGAYGIIGIFNDGGGQVAIENNYISSLRMNGSASGATCAGIYTQNGAAYIANNEIGSATLNSVRVDNNSNLYGIYSLDPNGISVENNIFRNFRQDGAAQCYGIHNAAGELSATGNLLSQFTLNGNNTLAGVFHTGTNAVVDNNSISDFTSTATTAGSPFVGVYLQTNSNVQANGNAIGSALVNNINLSANSGNYGIYKNGIGIGTFNNNTVRNITATSTGASASLNGIFSQNGDVTMEGNQIYNLITSSSNASNTLIGLFDGGAGIGDIISNNSVDSLYALFGGAASTNAYGIYSNGASGNMQKNKVTQISNASGTGSGQIIGILSANGSFNIINNVISLTNSPNSNSVNIYGIQALAAAQIWHNTVMIGGRDLGVGAVCSGVHTNSAAAVSVQNNIFQTSRTGGADMLAEKHDNVVGITTDFNYIEVKNDPNAVGSWNGTSHNFGNYLANSGAGFTITGTETLDSLGKPYDNYIGIDQGNSLGVVDDYNNDPRDATPWIGAWETGYLTPSGPYFLNDSTLAGDAFTSNVGRDKQGCGFDSIPCYSLSFLLDEYELWDGTPVYVDAGSYPDSNITFNSDTAYIIGLDSSLTEFDGSSLGLTNVRGFTISVPNVSFHNLSIYGYDNTTSGTPQGAGIEVTLGVDNLYLQSVHIYGNTSVSGGGIFTAGDTVYLDSCNIAYNTADQGGGIYVNNGLLGMDTTLFEFNTADLAGNAGGAIYSNSNTLLSSTRSVFADNSASNGNGGAVFSQNIISFFEGALFEGNNALLNGGALKVDGSTLLYLGTNCQIGLTANGNTADRGGAIHFSGDTLYIAKSSVQGNSASNTSDAGGAIYASGGVTILDRSYISNNAAPGATTAEGGAIYVTNARLGIDSCTLMNNTASDKGGAIYSTFSSDVSIDRSYLGILGNGNTGRTGGAIYHNGDSLQILRTDINDNTATASGLSAGGIYFGGSSHLLMDSCTIRNNDATTGSNGGGIIITNSGKARINGSQFHNNTCTNIGSAIQHGGDTLTLINSVVYENHASLNGAINCGGTSKTLILNCTVADNTSGGSGAGIVSTGTATMEVWNTVSYGNTTRDIWESAGSLDMYYTVYGVLQSAGIDSSSISADPLFTNAAGDDYSLAGFTSPAYNSGFNGMSPLDDILGNTRPRSGIVDAGAFENLQCDTATTPGTWNWTGVSNDWFHCQNWDVGSIPGPDSDVVVPNTANDPTISGTTAKCNTIAIDVTNGAKVNIDTGSGGHLDVNP